MSGCNENFVSKLKISFKKMVYAERYRIPFSDEAVNLVPGMSQKECICMRNSCGYYRDKGDDT